MTPSLPPDLRFRFRADSLHALGFLLATGSGLAMAIKHLPIDGSVMQMAQALLLAARSGAFSGAFEDGLKRLGRWQ